MMETIRPLPVISTAQVVHKLFEGGNFTGRDGTDAAVCIAAVVFESAA